MTTTPDMCAALRKWADRLRDENATMAAELAGYADAWEAERAEMSAGDASMPVIMRWREQPNGLYDPSAKSELLVSQQDAMAAVRKAYEGGRSEAREVGEEVMRTWFVLKDAGAHPGRTDDLLSDCVRRAIAANAAHIAEQDEEIARLRAEPTRAYAEGRGDQYEDDCVTARLLFENLDDADVCGDGRINTTRVRELMAHFELPRPAECSYPTCTRAECEGLGCVADRINTERDQRIAVVVQSAQEKTQ